jgi:hypothetical protein
MQMEQQSNKNGINKILTEQKLQEMAGLKVKMLFYNT